MRRQATWTAFVSFALSVTGSQAIISARHSQPPPALPFVFASRARPQGAETIASPDIDKTEDKMCESRDLEEGARKLLLPLLLSLTDRLALGLSSGPSAPGADSREYNNVSGYLMSLSLLDTTVTTL